MRKRAGRIRGVDPADLQPLTENEIATFYAVEHVNGVGAVQGFQRGQTGQLIQADIKVTTEFWNNDFDRLATAFVYEVRRSAVDETFDPRWLNFPSPQTYDVDFINNSPPRYEYTRDTSAKTLQEAKTGSEERVLRRYSNYGQIYQFYFVDADFRDKFGIDGGTMNQDASQAYQALANAANAYQSAVSSANEVRDIQAAEAAFDATLEGLWLP